MRVVLFGASGYLGSHVAEQLIASGYDIVCPVRKGGGTAFLAQIHAPRVLVDFDDLTELNALIDSAATVINCIADTRSHLSLEQRCETDVDLTLRLFMLAQKNNARRFIQLSTVMVYGFDRPAVAINEDYPISRGYVYNQATQLREHRLLKAFTGGTELVILRPANALGQRDQAFLPGFLPPHKAGFFPVIGADNCRFSCIDARDVGRAMAHLVSVKADNPEVFLVKGFDTDWLALKEVLDKSIGKTSRLLPLPKKLMMTFAGFCEWLFPYGMSPPVTRFDLSVLSTDTLFDDSKIRSTGFSPNYTLTDAVESALLELS